MFQIRVEHNQLVAMTGDLMVLPLDSNRVILREWRMVGDD